MPSNNSKYFEEMRTQTAEHILRNGKTATGVAEEMGIDTNRCVDGSEITAERKACPSIQK